MSQGNYGGRYEGLGGPRGCSNHKTTRTLKILRSNLVEPLIIPSVLSALLYYLQKIVRGWGFSYEIETFTKFKYLGKWLNVKLVRVANLFLTEEGNLV